MNDFKNQLNTVFQLWDKCEYRTALEHVEQLQQTWPGNAQLQVLWASLVQLQEEAEHTLEEAKDALQRAIDLEPDSPTPTIELGHFLDSVEDDPHGAVNAYAAGVKLAGAQLMDGLLGQAKALHQLNRQQDFLRCIRHILCLAALEQTEALPETLLLSLSAAQLKGGYGEQIRDLLNEPMVERSA